MNEYSLGEKGSLKKSIKYIERVLKRKIWNNIKITCHNSRHKILTR